METFIWCPSKNLPGTIKYRARKSQYGDGYEQIVGDGINRLGQTWNLQFAGKTAKISQIKAFLDAHESDTAFLWTPPLGAEAAFRAGEYSITVIKKDLFNLAVTFRQVYKI